MKIISASLDVTKIDKSKLVAGKNGAKYCNIQIFLNSEPDKYGNHCSISLNQSKEEREAKEPKVYLGNGKIVFSNSPGEQQAQQPAQSSSGNTDDLPF